MSAQTLGSARQRDTARWIPGCWGWSRAGWLVGAWDSYARPCRGEERRGVCRRCEEKFVPRSPRSTLPAPWTQSTWQSSWPYPRSPSPRPSGRAHWGIPTASTSTRGELRTRSCVASITKGRRSGLKPPATRSDRMPRGDLGLRLSLRDTFLLRNRRTDEPEEASLAGSVGRGVCPAVDAGRGLYLMEPPSLLGRAATAGGRAWIGASGDAAGPGRRPGARRGSSTCRGRCGRAGPGSRV